MQTSKQLASNSKTLNSPVVPDLPCQQAIMVSQQQTAFLVSRTAILLLCILVGTMPCLASVHLRTDHLGNLIVDTSESLNGTMYLDELDVKAELETTKIELSKAQISLINMSTIIESNAEKHASDLLTLRSVVERALWQLQPSPILHVIATTAGGARAVQAADIDGDGHMDVLSASLGDNQIEWYRNLNGSGTFSTERKIASVSHARSVHAADIDNDGDMDVLSASSNTHVIAWYENIDGLGGFGPAIIISTTAHGARAVYAADLDGDSDLDVLSACFGAPSGKIVWYRNENNGTAFTEINVSTSVDGGTDVYAADIDGDGHLDVLSASAGDNKIAWYRNNGVGGFSTENTISTSVVDAHSVHVADLDGDGDNDVLSASLSTTLSDHKVSWYRNNGTGGFSNEINISTTDLGAYSAYAADLDGDGDADVISASYTKDQIAWYRNNGTGGFSKENIISKAADGAHMVYAADVNGDGNMDVLSASVNDNKIAWYDLQLLGRMN